MKAATPAILSQKVLIQKPALTELLLQSPLLHSEFWWGPFSCSSLDILFFTARWLCNSRGSTIASSMFWMWSSASPMKQLRFIHSVYLFYVSLNFFKALPLYFYFKTFISHSTVFRSAILSSNLCLAGSIDLSSFNVSWVANSDCLPVSAMVSTELFPDPLNFTLSWSFYICLLFTPTILVF